jgi:uncharacterized membrane protein YhdT
MWTLALQGTVDKLLEVMPGVRPTTRKAMPATVLSGGLIAVSLLWFASAWVFHVANLQSTDGIFDAPVWSLLVLLLGPLVSLVLGPWLVRARRVDGQRLRAVDYLALLAGVAPFVFVGVTFLLLYLHRDG